MTIAEIGNQLTIQGNIIVKKYNEEKDDFDILLDAKGIDGVIPEWDTFFEHNIIYMYPADNAIVFEVE